MDNKINKINSDFDFELDNYGFDDLRKLFLLEEGFSMDELKTAKNIVYKYHPDKSQFDKNIFIFYSQAYKKLIEETKLHNKLHDDPSINKDYCCDTFNIDPVSKLTKEQWDKDFNDCFDRTTPSQHGYGDWLKEEVNTTTKANSISEMNQIIDEQKTILRERQLILARPIEDVHESGMVNLSGESGNSSAVFDSL